jgi:magnesium-transporting ATPase (P-type)
VLIAIAVVLVFQLLFTYAPPMQALFGSAALGFLPWLEIVIVAMLAFALVELEKAWQRHRANSRDSGMQGG